MNNDGKNSFDWSGFVFFLILGLGLSVYKVCLILKPYFHFRLDDMTQIEMIPSSKGNKEDDIAL